MYSPFSYESIASGDGLIGRKDTVDQMCDILRKGGRHIMLYGAMKSGKDSVVKAALDRYGNAGHRIHICEINLFNVRSGQDLTSLFRAKMLQCFREVNTGTLLPFDIDIDAVPDKKLFDLPAIIAEESQQEIIIYFKEFQNIAEAGGPSFSLEYLDKLWSKQKKVRYIMTGSCVNMMKYLTEEKKLFYYTTVQIELPPIERRLVCEFITSNFMRLGRVIEMEEAMEICNIASGNMWYVKQLCSICYSRPIGYVNRKIVNQAAQVLVALHDTRFNQTMLDLTNHQINFMKAIVDGVEKFSSADIMEAYHLNSSANVFRVKDALKKKEVITFDRDDTAHILDPLFEYWLRHYYFVQ